MPKSQFGFAHVILVLIVVVILIVGGYLLLRKAGHITTPLNNLNQLTQSGSTGLPNSAQKDIPNFASASLYKVYLPTNYSIRADDVTPVILRENNSFVGSFQTGDKTFNVFAKYTGSSALKDQLVTVTFPGQFLKFDSFIAVNLTQDYFKVKPLGMWVCANENQAMTCSNSWGDARRLKYTMGVTTPYSGQQTIVFYCQKTKDSSLYSLNKCGI